MEAKTSFNVQPAVAATGQVNNPMTDPMSMVKSIVTNAVNQPSAEEQQKAERLGVLDTLRITTSTDVPPEEPALSVDGVGFFALCDIHGVKAKQKQGKTTALKVMVAALLKGEQFRVKCELEEPLVLWLDTEQKPADVKLVLCDIKQMTGLEDDYIDSHLMLYHMRKLNYETLLGDMRLLIDKHNPQVVIVDGIVEFVSSFNDEVMSRQLIHDLLLICEEKHCAIVNVLHENKAADDRNMRGHLGTVLSQAAGTVLECNKSKQEIITVCCSDPRHGKMPEWSICFDAEGHIIDADAQRLQAQQQAREARAQQHQAERDEKQRLRQECAQGIISSHGGCISRHDLTLELMQQLKLSHSTASAFIKSQLGTALHEVNGRIQASPDPVLPF